jgi:hypothetical protein
VQVFKRLLVRKANITKNIGQEVLLRSLFFTQLLLSQQSLYLVYRHLTLVVARNYVDISRAHDTLNINASDCIFSQTLLAKNLQLLLRVVKQAN